MEPFLQIMKTREYFSSKRNNYSNMNSYDDTEDNEIMESCSEYSALPLEDKGFMLTGNTFGYRGSRFPPFLRRQVVCCVVGTKPPPPSLLGKQDTELWANFTTETIPILTKKYRWTLYIFTLQLLALYWVPYITRGGVLGFGGVVLIMFAELLLFYYIIVLDCPVLDVFLRTRRRLLEVEELFIPLFADSGVKLSYVMEQVPACCGLCVAPITYWSFQPLHHEQHRTTAMDFGTGDLDELVKSADI